jgi:transcriptional regulator
VYIPNANSEDRPEVLRQMMAAHPLAAVVTLTASGLVASHIPLGWEPDASGLVWEPDASGLGVLKGHVSRANTQWKDLAEGVDALAIFAGPQHYISAGWYPGKQGDGKEVPTWNYVVVHAYGPLRIVHDADWLLAHLQSLTNTHEASFTPPWKVSDAPADFIASLLNGIVGFELPIRRLEGKWKVSQNRNEADREAVIRGLDDLDTPESLTMKQLVESARRR